MGHAFFGQADVLQKSSATCFKKWSSLWSKNCGDMVGCFLRVPNRPHAMFPNRSTTWSSLFFGVPFSLRFCSVKKHGRRVSLSSKTGLLCFVVSRMTAVSRCVPVVPVSLCICLCPLTTTHTLLKRFFWPVGTERKRNHFVATMSGGQETTRQLDATRRRPFLEHGCGHAQRPFVRPFFRHCAYPPKMPSLPHRTVTSQGEDCECIPDGQRFEAKAIDEMQGTPWRPSTLHQGTRVWSHTTNEEEQDNYEEDGPEETRRTYLTKKNQVRQPKKSKKQDVIFSRIGLSYFFHQVTRRAEVWTSCPGCKYITGEIAGAR